MFHSYLPPSGAGWLPLKNKNPDMINPSLGAAGTATLQMVVWFTR